MLQDGDPYRDEMEQCVGMIMDELANRGWNNKFSLAYQSRVGPVRLSRMPCIVCAAANPGASRIVPHTPAADDAIRGQPAFLLLSRTSVNQLCKSLAYDLPLRRGSAS